jgi:hypothetical protein
LERPQPELTSAEATVRQVNVLLIDMEMGGWLYNLSPEAGASQDNWFELRETAEAVDAVGAASEAKVLLEIADIVERAPQSSSSTWEDFMAAADPTSRVAVLEKIMLKEIPTLYKKLEANTIRHFGCEKT